MYQIVLVPLCGLYGHENCLRDEKLKNQPQKISANTNRCLDPVIYGPPLGETCLIVCDVCLTLIVTVSVTQVPCYTRIWLILE